MKEAKFELTALDNADIITASGGSFLTLQGYFNGTDFDEVLIGTVGNKSETWERNQSYSPEGALPILIQIGEFFGGDFTNIETYGEFMPFKENNVFFDEKYKIHGGTVSPTNLASFFARGTDTDDPDQADIYNGEYEFVKTVEYPNGAFIRR